MLVSSPVPWLHGGSSSAGPSFLGWALGGLADADSSRLGPCSFANGGCQAAACLFQLQMLEKMCSALHIVLI
eukprot:6109792-Heterocapsa_arctica.AAC.1